jgi:hypothetical protein
MGSFAAGDRITGCSSGEREPGGQACGDGGQQNDPQSVMWPCPRGPALPAPASCGAGRAQQAGTLVAHPDPPDSRVDPLRHLCTAARRHHEAADAALS